MGAKQTHKLAIHLISRAVHEVVLTAYTFDLAPPVEALKEVAMRGVRDTVLTDHGHTPTGTTQAMPARLGDLIEMESLCASAAVIIEALGFRPRRLSNVIRS